MYSTVRDCGSSYCFRIISVNSSTTKVEFSKADYSAFGTWKVYWRVTANGSAVAECGVFCEVWNGFTTVEKQFPTSNIGFSIGSSVTLAGIIWVGPTPDACGDYNDAGSKLLSYNCQ